MKTIFSLLAMASLLFFACKKEDDHSRDVTKENIAASYRLTAATSQTGLAAPVDEFASMDACEKDNTIRFNMNDTYDYMDTGTQCSPPDNGSGNWSLPSTTQLKLDTNVFTIKSFDGKTLILSATDTYNGTTSTYTQTLVKL